MPRTGENIYKRKDGRWEGRYIKTHLPYGIYIQLEFRVGYKDTSADGEDCVEERRVCVKKGVSL